jgi:superfamily II DNA helicase RecQ
MLSASRCGLKRQYGGLVPIGLIWILTGRIVTVVISPLLALMVSFVASFYLGNCLTTFQTNQIDAARALGIPTESISGSTTYTDRKRIENDLKCGHPWTRLLYITPELLAMSPFRKVLTTIHQQGQLIRVAIDEAHCIRYAIPASLYYDH